MLVLVSDTRNLQERETWSIDTDDERGGTTTLVSSASLVGTAVVPLVQPSSVSSAMWLGDCRWPLRCLLCSVFQWSFLKTGTMRTLASQVEIGVWVQAPGTLAPPPVHRLWLYWECVLEWVTPSRCGGLGLLPPKQFRVFFLIYSNVVFMCILKNCDSGNAILMRSCSFSTMGMVFPCIPHEMTPAVFSILWHSFSWM